MPTQVPNAAVIAVYVAYGVVALVFAALIARSLPGGVLYLFRKYPILWLPGLLLVNLQWTLSADYPFMEFLGVPFLDFEFLNLTWTISTLFVLMLLVTPLAITFHVMATHAAAEGTLGRRPGAFKGWSKRFFTLLLAYLAGTFGILFILGLILFLAAVIGIWPVIILMIPVGFLMSFLTVTWYAHVVDRREGFWAGLFGAIRFSLRNSRSLFKPVILNFLLFGFLIFYMVTVVSRGPAQQSFGAGGNDFSPSHHTNLHRKTNFKVNVFWLLSFDESCRWHDELAAAAEEEKVPIADYLLQTLMIMLSAVFLSKYSLIYLVHRPLRGGFEP